MIQRLTHANIFVLNQQDALAFYRDKLGFEVRYDIPLGDSGVRWLTISPKGQPDLQIVLAPAVPGPMFDAETARRMRELIENGGLGAGVYETDDIHGDYERLCGAGVEFVQPPKEQPYATEAIIKDNSGNRLSLSQLKK
ncbi:MAG TPA: VOC family protein [Trueperaceae bacterium]